MLSLKYCLKSRWKDLIGNLRISDMEEKIKVEMLLVKKIQLNKFNDPVGFIQ